MAHNCPFVGGSDGKASGFNAGDPGSIPGSGRCPGEGNGNPFQYSCLENSVDGGDSPWGCKESDTTERLHFHFHFSGWNKSASTSLTFCEHLSLKRKCVCVCVCVCVCWRGGPRLAFSDAGKRVAFLDYIMMGRPCIPVTLKGKHGLLS